MIKQLELAATSRMNIEIDPAIIDEYNMISSLAFSLRLGYGAGTFALYEAMASLIFKDPEQHRSNATYMFPTEDRYEDYVEDIDMRNSLLKASEGGGFKLSFPIKHVESPQQTMSPSVLWRALLGPYELRESEDMTTILNPKLFQGSTITPEMIEHQVGDYLGGYELVLLSLALEKLGANKSLSSAQDIELKIKPSVVKSKFFKYQDGYADFKEEADDFYSFGEVIKQLKMGVRIAIAPARNSAVLSSTSSVGHPAMPSNKTEGGLRPVTTVKEAKAVAVKNFADASKNMLDAMPVSNALIQAKGEWAFRVNNVSCRPLVTLLATYEISQDLGDFLVQKEDAQVVDVAPWVSYALNKYKDGEEVFNITAIDVAIKGTKDFVPRNIRGTNGLTINEDGILIRVPKAELDLYMALAKERSEDRTTSGDYAIAYDPLILNYGADAYSPDGPVEQKTPSRIINTAIHLDTGLSVLSYINSGGGLNTIDCSKWLPASLRDVRDLYSRPVLSGGVGGDSSVSNRLGNIIRISDHLGVDIFDTSSAEAGELDLLVPDGKTWNSEIKQNFAGCPYGVQYSLTSAVQALEANDLSGLVDFFDKVRSMLMTIAETPQWKDYDKQREIFDYEEMGTQVLLSDLCPNDGSPPLRFLGRNMGKLYEVMGEKAGKEDLMSSIYGLNGAFTKMLEAIGLITAFHTYPGANAVIKMDKKERKVYLNPDVPENYSPEAVPNLRKGVTFMPQQVTADSFLKNSPPFVIAAIQAGGGKTITILSSAVRDMGKGLVKMPLIMMPNRLQVNYVEDAVFIFDGKINIFSIQYDLYKADPEALATRIWDAPPNTVFVMDMDFPKQKAVKIQYGTSEVVYSETAEWLRQFPWDLVVLDESHWVANAESQRSKGVTKIMIDAPMKRLATGTFLNNNPTDAVNQTSLLRPSILGNVEKFKTNYGESFGPGGKVLKWSTRTKTHVPQRLKQQATYIQLKRKVWAHLLPDKVGREEFYFVDLSEQQRSIYESILKEVIDDIKNDPKLAKKLKSGKEEDAGAIEFMLARHLARIERFLIAPGYDELGMELLDDKEAVSPKVKRINKILDSHFSDPDAKDGKVLIFTSYKVSALSIYEGIKSKYRKMAMHFESGGTAGELIQRMKTDTSVRIVVGTEFSLNTGLNFQMFNRLIRIESVWNPGTLEQGQSRIERPDFKHWSSGKPQKKMWLDWIIVNRTIDVTKASRLISKLLDNTAIEESGNPAYDVVPTLELISMNFASIAADNDFNESLVDYLNAYKVLQGVNRKEMLEHARKNPKLLAPKPVPVGKDIEGSVIGNMPYIDNHKLPYMRELGLQSLFSYAEELEKSVRNLELNEIKGLHVHTDRGDGVVVSQSIHMVTIKPYGTNAKIRVPKLQAFVKNDGATHTKEIKHLIAEKSGLRLQTTTDINKTANKTFGVPPLIPGDTDGFADNSDTVENKAIQVYTALVNGLYSLIVDYEDPDVDVKHMESLGFAKVGAYMYAEMPTVKKYSKFLDKLYKLYVVPGSCQRELNLALEMWQNSKKSLNKVKLKTQKDLRNFYQLRRLKSKKGQLRVYPAIENGELFVCCFLKKQPEASKMKTRIKMDSLEWVKESTEMMLFTQKKKEIKYAIKQIEDSGIVIENKEDLIEEYNNFKSK